MVFWRNRSEKKAETPVIVEEERAEVTADAKPPALTQAQSAVPAAETNVVTLVTNRLADRLAGVGAPTDADAVGGQDLKPVKPPSVPQGLVAVDPVTEPHHFGQRRAVAKIRSALASSRGGHLVIMGEAGTGRLALAETLAAEVVREPAADWIYVVDRQAPSRARAFSVPSGEGGRVAHEIHVALDKASAAFERQIKSDEHRISLDLLDEETRYLSEKAVDQVRQRAESQNIAVVKSLDGYVLAPMHEGRVVRSDVFRALPEALKRNVEAKITTLEGELQSIVSTLPDVEFEAGEKFEMLMRQTALRAIRPSLQPLKRLCADVPSAAAAIEAVEETFVAATSAAIGGSGAFLPATLLDCGADKREAARPVMTARRISAASLLGEIGRDARGRPTHVPGYLMRAGSGFLIIEAWRLVAEPAAWAALSSALAAKEIVPVSAPGIAMSVDPVPLAATVILIADDQSLAKLEALEPGMRRYFPHIATLATTAAVADMSEREFAQGVARLAEAQSLKPIAQDVAPILYKDAVRRGGGRVSLAGIPLVNLLHEAAEIGDVTGAAEIRASDVNEALAQRADGASS